MNNLQLTTAPSSAGLSLLPTFDKENLWKNIAREAAGKSKLKKHIVDAVTKLTSHIEFPRVDTTANTPIIFHNKVIFKLSSNKIALEEYSIETLFNLARSNRVVPLLIVNFSRKASAASCLQQEETRVAMKLSELPDEVLSGISSNASFRKELLKVTSACAASLQEEENEKASAEQHCLDFSDTLSTYFNDSENRDDTYVVPDFALFPAQFKEQYLSLYEQKWKILADEGEKEVSFQELQKLWLTHRNPYEIFISNGDDSLDGMALAVYEHQHLIPFLDVPWRIITPKLFYSIKDDDDDDDPIIETIDTAEVKPFIKGMQLFLGLDYTGETMEEGLNTLQQEDEWAACLTLIFQFIDLHFSNVGFVLQKNASTKEFKNYLFDIPSLDKKALFLSDVAGLYLDGEITDTTELSFYDPKTEERDVELNRENMRSLQYRVNEKTPLERVAKQIKDIPRLAAALQSPWQMVLFDCDNVLGESNDLMSFFSDNKSCHQIPLRNHLLSTEWAKKKLSEKTIQQLAQFDAIEPELFSWIDHNDSPLHLQLSKNEKQELHEIVQGILKDEQLTLTKLRKDKESTNYSHTHLYAPFEKALVDDSKYPALWEALYRMLPHLEMKTEDDRKKIAKALYPRLSTRQRKALSSRIQAIKAFFQYYHKLQASSISRSISSFNERKELLHKIIEDAISPFSAVEREEFSCALLIIHDMETLGALEEKLLAAMTPSLITLTKVQYPLVSDVITLYEATYELDDYFQEFIGEMEKKKSLEHLLCAYIEHESKNNEELQNNESVQNSLKQFQEDHNTADLQILLDHLEDRDIGDAKKSFLALGKSLIKSITSDPQNPPHFAGNYSSTL